MSDPEQKDVHREGEPDSEASPSESSRRMFISKNLKRAAYIAPIVWSVSAREAHASQMSGLSGPPTPE